MAFDGTCENVYLTSLEVNLIFLYFQIKLFIPLPEAGISDWNGNAEIAPLLINQTVNLTDCGSTAENMTLHYSVSYQ